MKIFHNLGRVLEKKIPMTQKSNNDFWYFCLKSLTMCISNFFSLFWMIFMVFLSARAILPRRSHPNEVIFDVFPYFKVKFTKVLKNGGFWTVSPQRKSISLWKSVKNIQKNMKKLLNGVKSRKNQKLRKSYVDLWVKGPKFQTYLAIFTVKIQCKKMWKFSIIWVGYLRKKYQWPRSQTTIFDIFA